MNSRVDEIHDFIKMNVLIGIDKKKGKQVSFIDQLSSRSSTNLRNQGASSSQTYNVNHAHVDDEAVETTLAISRLRSGKNLLNPYKNHSFYQDLIDEETPTGRTRQ